MNKVIDLERKKEGRKERKKGKKKGRKEGKKERKEGSQSASILTCLSLLWGWWTLT